MLSGKPILASYTGYPSMINEANCGTFVPAENVVLLKEEIERLSAMSSEVRNKMGHRGYEWLLANRQFHHLAESYKNIIEEL
ncbi:hypothetical protein NMT30_002028 [Vibrio cholerae]|nr:hypothetical protein [Vibrio cholerae]EKF9806131.1 hypothetical protein [Vibrio cholerae]